MCDLSVLSGIIPRDLVYTHKYDINYKIDKYKEDDSDIYYNCYIKEIPCLAHECKYGGIIYTAIL